MSLEETFRLILVDPDYVGLHWSIPRDTPDESRAAAHILAAHEAKRRRDFADSRQHHGPINPQTMTYICCGQTQVDYLMNHRQPAWCKDGKALRSSQETR